MTAVRTWSLGLEEPDPETVLFDSEPIVAWRAWHTHEDPLVLRSASWKIRWPRRKPMRAHCLTAFFSHGRATFAAEPHPCPTLPCACGVYAVLTEEQARGWALGGTAIIGHVGLWGKVLRFEKGYRAEYAYPIDLMESSTVDVEVIAAAYGVPMIAH